MIPRWRDFATTVRLGELRHAGPARQDARPAATVADLQEQLSSWGENHSLALAADAVSAAVSLGLDREVQEPAAYILKHVGERFPLARLMADQVLNGRNDALDINLPPSLDEGFEERIRARIRLLRQRTRHSPRDAITWVDLAREYASLGQLVPSTHAINIALRLAPDNRFVVRSAVSFFVSSGNPDIAYDMVTRSQRTAHDPWLLSAHLAIASQTEKSSPLVRRARLMGASGSFSDFDLSELRAELGSLELSHSSIRKAKSQFRESLLEPTENTLAQVGWASRVDSRIAPHLEDAKKPKRSFEADAWLNLLQGRVSSALNDSWLWLQDQPFSSKPAMHGSYLACLDQKYDIGRGFAAFGHSRNPKDVVLANNFAFALAHTGELEAAERLLVGATRQAELEPEEQLMLLATFGMLAYKKGAIVEASKLYAQATMLAKEARRRSLRALVLYFQALEVEEIDPVLHEKLRREIRDEIASVEFPEKSLISKKLRLSQLG